MGFLPEVGSALLQVGQPRVTRAEDSEGRPLAWVPPPTGQAPWLSLLRGTNVFQPLRLTAGLEGAALGAEGGKLTRLEGVLPVQIMADKEELVRGAPAGLGAGASLTLWRFRRVGSYLPFSFRDVPLP
jgi:hypothetical protein